MAAVVERWAMFWAEVTGPVGMQGPKGNGEAAEADDLDAGCEVRSVGLE